MTVALEDIEAAARILAGHVTRTPTVPASALSSRFGADIVLKLENLQLTGSFKTRGALVKLSGLGSTERRRGVIAMSAGNHAQGVAYHARTLGLKATIVMPDTTPFTKVERTEELGARVVLQGGGLAECRATVEAMARRERLAIIHPYDDPAIIAGQGTVALELLADAPDVDTIIVPVGGGGLIAGIATAARALRRRIRVIGVQAEAYPAMTLATRGKRRRKAPGGDASTLADGIAVKRPGRLTSAIVRRLVSDIRLVDESAIETAIQILANDEKVVAEGAGAAPLAYLLQHGLPKGARKVGLIISGGNIDPRLLANVLMRGLAREGRIGRLRIKLSDAPGTLATVAKLIGERDGNIIEIVHHRLFSDVPVRMTDIDVMVETQDAEHLRAVLGALRTAGFAARLLSESADGSAN